MTTQHTAGPWGWRKRRGNNEYEHSVFVPFREIAAISPTPETEIWLGTVAGDKKEAQECAANARLIAAAPDMLEACMDFVAKCDSGKARSKNSYAKMKAAIAKATGAE